MKVNAQTCKPIITQTGSIIYCMPTSAVTLTVNDPSILAYSWSTGAVSSVISVSTAGTYTVTATYTGGCTGKSSISILETAYHVEVDQFISMCIGGKQKITITNPIAGVTYNWSIGAGSINNITPSSGTSATIDYMVATAPNNFFIISYQYGFCQQQDTFYLMQCCDFGPWVEHQDFENELSSNLDPGDFNSHSYPIHLYGTITIDGFFNIQNCSAIKMGPGALIKVVNGGVLYITTSDLSGACGRMWRGIQVERGGLLKVGEVASIADAEIAIDSKDGSSVTIDCSPGLGNNQIINNYIGVKTTGDLWGSLFDDVTFDFTSAFLTPYNGQKLIPTNKPFAAIVLKDMITTPVVFGASTHNNGIEIYNHACGFFATNYSFSMYNTTFNNISNGNNYGGFYESQNGWAVYAQTDNAQTINNRSLYILGLGKTATPATMNNCRGGVFTRAMSVTVDQCNINCFDQGINNRLSQSPSAMVYTNNAINITTSTTVPVAASVRSNGIYSLFSGTTTGVIAGNDINVSAPPAALTGNQKSCCIFMDDVAGADNSLITIGYNVCRMFKNTKYGIKLNNISKTQLENNFSYCNQGGLSEDNNDLHYCYWAKNCIGVSYFMNHANSSTTTTYKPNAVGYYNDISPRWIYTCNDAFQVGTGFQFDRDCVSPENFKGNFMENNDFGLYINKPAGAIGAQTHKGNQWSLAALVPDASVNGGAVVSGSPFEVHTVSGTNYHPSAGGGLFTQTPGSPFLCDGIAIVQPPDTVTIVEGEVQHADSTDETDNGAMGDYVLNRNLYGQIDAQSAIVGSSTIIENYYDSMSLKAIGQLQQVANSYSNYINELLAISNAWQANDSVMRSKVNQLQQNSYLLYNGSLNATDSSAIITANALLQQQIQMLAASNNNLASQAQGYHQNNATTALAKNSIVTTNSNYESNQKTVHQIYASTIATGNANFTPTEITTLYNIAQQCLSYGGPAVLEARSMYALIDPTVNFESVPCNLGGNRWGLNDESETKTDELLVYPNPANDILYIYLPIEKQTDVAVEIYNLTGVKIKSYKFENASNTLQIVTSDLAQGLYVIKVNANSNNFYKSVKVQVIK